MHQIERQQRDAGDHRGEKRRPEGPPPPPQQDEEGRGQDGERDHPVVAAGVECQHEEERGEEGVGGPFRAGEAHGEQHDEGQPLRSQRRQVGDLVGADGREREGRPCEESDALSRPQLARQPERGQARDNEREQARNVVKEHRVVGEGGEGQDKYGGAEDRLVEPQRVAERVEDVPVGELCRTRLQRVDFPADLPGEEGGVARVHHEKVGGERPREEDGEGRVETQAAQRWNHGA